MGSRSVTCHPTLANAPRPETSQAGRYPIYLPRRDGRLSWPLRMVIYQNGLAVRRQLKPRLHDRKSNVLSVMPPSHIHEVQKLSQFSAEIFYKHERRSQRRFTNASKIFNNEFWNQKKWLRVPAGPAKKRKCNRMDLHLAAAASWVKKEEGRKLQLSDRQLQNKFPTDYGCSKFQCCP